MGGYYGKTKKQKNNKGSIGASIYRRKNVHIIIRLFSVLRTDGFYIKKHMKKIKKVLALYGCMDYNITCCDIDSVEAEVAA